MYSSLCDQWYTNKLFVRLIRKMFHTCSEVDDCGGQDLNSHSQLQMKMKEHMQKMTPNTRPQLRKQIEKIVQSHVTPSQILSKKVG